MPGHIITGDWLTSLELSRVEEEGVAGRVVLGGGGEKSSYC